jgi:hypothetical protein
MALSDISQQTVNRWREHGVLLRFHEDLLETWERDRSLGYPFLRDNDPTLDVTAQLHEHERFGNLNYATQMKVWSANKRLEKILDQYNPGHNQFASQLSQPLPKKYFIGEDLEVSAFFADLVSALDAVVGQVVLIYGFPIELRWVGWTQLEYLLSEMSAPWDKASNPREKNKKSKHIYNVMPSGDLVNVVLPDKKRIEAFIEYRNSYTHRTFFGTIFDKEGFYLPKDANVLPSLVINPLEVARDTGTPEDVACMKSELFNPLPLHKYCEDIYGRVRELIEQVYEQVVQTYHVRLDDPAIVENPHKLYRLGLET